MVSEKDTDEPMYIYKTLAQLVPKDRLEEVREGIKAYKRAKRAIASVGDMNRKLLKKGGK